MALAEPPVACYTPARAFISKANCREGIVGGNAGDADFETLAEVELNHLAERLEAASDALEIDFEAGIVTVELESGGQYLINRHAVNREIWLSSPVSGAWHFRAADGLWRSTRGTETLRALLAAELSESLGHPVDLD